MTSSPLEPSQIAKASPTATAPVRVSLLALPEASGGVLYSLYEVLGSVGRTWMDLTGEPEDWPGFDLQIVGQSGEPFLCHQGVPVAPQAGFADVTATDILIVPDLALDMTGDPRGRWPDAVEWIAALDRGNTLICSVCTGSVLLAEAGLLDQREAASHWAAIGLFHSYYPGVRIRPQSILEASGPDERYVTSGGVAAWQELCLYLVRRYFGERAAIHTAKIYLLGDRHQGQLPFAAARRPLHHDDAAIARCQVWIADEYRRANPVAAMAAQAGMAERTFKRRFQRATGFTPVEYVQTLRMEEAKQQLEMTDATIEDIARSVGYEDPASFRRLFKRHTGLTPANYRRRYRAVGRLATGQD